MLHAETVTTLLHTCLGSLRNPDRVEVDGITHLYCFDRQLLEQHRGEIEAGLSHLPLEFFNEAGSGGGGTFLNLCYRSDGDLWTGDQSVMEALVALGIALGRVKVLVPRYLWDILPGGVPYLLVTGVSPTRSAA
jgi:hypothetical protein